MRTIKLIILALSISLAGSTSKADHPLPPLPEGGLTVIGSGECTEDIYHEVGQCALLRDRDGNLYAIFGQDGVVKVIRQITGDTFIELYIADGYGTY